MQICSWYLDQLVRSLSPPLCWRGVCVGGEDWIANGMGWDRKRARLWPRTTTSRWFGRTRGRVVEKQRFGSLGARGGLSSDTYADDLHLYPVVKKQKEAQLYSDILHSLLDCLWETSDFVHFDLLPVAILDDRQLHVEKVLVDWQRSPLR